MVSDSGGGYTVLDNGTTLATDVPFQVAHEFVHQGGRLCASGEDHIARDVHLRETA
jgi:hypothetical protein